MRIRLVTCAALVALVATACGSDDPATVAEPVSAEAADVASPDAPDRATPGDGLAGPGDVPDLDMVDVRSGETVSLQSLVDGQTPLLFWFWAPH